MNYLDLIKQEIEKVLGELTSEKINFSVDIPDLERGDVTTNVCLVASKILKKSPKEVADILISRLEKNLDFICTLVEFKNPGFINFWLKKEFIRKGGKIKEKSFLENIINFFGPHLTSPINRGGISAKYFSKKVLVEHTSVNLFKPFGIGHMMTNFTGEFVYRILKEFGAETINMSYPSDISIGIAKAIYKIKKDGGLEQNIFKQNEKEIVSYLGECYMLGVNIYKEAEENKNEVIIREVKDIANNLYRNTTSEDLEIFEKCKKINLDYFSVFVKSLGSHFDNFIFESEAGVEGKKLVIENIPKVFQNSEGAIIYVPGEERKDINTTVFINGEGNPTYPGKDLGLLSLKFKKFDPDYSFFITDNEQIPHFKVVLDAAKKINKNWYEKSFHISHGRMTFKGQKMSSRLGGVPTGEGVIENVLEAVREKSGDRNISEEVMREVALSALRISILRAKPGVNIDFDPDKALSFEGDSGPYLCYTSARLHSLLQKGKENNLFPGCQLAHDGSERNLERKIFQFQNILENVVEEIAPQKLVTYLFELAGEFNNFYAHTKIISETKNSQENKFESEHYLYVVQKTLNVLTKGLHILGITAPEKM